jgi:hypothetical protein
VDAGDEVGDIAGFRQFSIALEDLGIDIELVSHGGTFAVAVAMD